MGSINGKRRLKMRNVVRNTLVVCGFAGMLATAVPAFAQTVVIGPYPYAGAYDAYAGPYPRYRGYRSYYYQDYPAGSIPVACRSPIASSDGNRGGPGLLRPTHAPSANVNRTAADRGQC